MTESESASRMIRPHPPRLPGIIYNTQSGRHQQRWGRHALPTQVPSVEANTPTEIRQAVFELAARGIDTLCIAGGDGTVQCALGNLLLDKPFDYLPTLALIPTGSTNMTARDVGFVNVRRHGWQPLLDWASAGGTAADATVSHRAVLKIQPSDEQQPICGMFFGAGAVHHAVQYTQHHLHGMGLRGEVGPSVTFLRFLKSVVTGNRQQFSPVDITGHDDHNHHIDGPTLMLLASTLDRLVLNFRPFWGQEQAPMAWTAVSQNASRFLLRLPFLARGWSSAFRDAESAGYASHNSHELTLHFDGHFIVDGEFYQSRPEDGPIRLSIAGHVPFLSL